MMMLFNGNLVVWYEMFRDMGTMSGRRNSVSDSANCRRVVFEHRAPPSNTTIEGTR